jgi:N-methylhydantoinase A/oxoprolinase/acetone carboxylase beta subunit
MNNRFGLGIDAGGTYTDVALLDLTTGKVVVYAKSLTTRPDPSDGIQNALAKINKEFLPKVSMISLATTFATNAIVEDRGAEAGLILIGYDEKPADIPVTTRVVMVDGGHTVSGDEKAPLDLSFLRENLDSFLNGLEAVAITGFFSVRNSDHEHQAARLIRERHDVSIVLGHQLSMRLDAMRRATTAWWNARLIPLVRNLIRATENVLSEMNISAPLMIVKGDGTLMSVETSMDRPIDTILSGPAASILGAKFLANTENALIVDMGGTTTDMALLIDGRVSINPQGAQVGKWKTHVEAAKVRTTGLGGDSLISIGEEGNLCIGPRRVVPLCLLAERFPEAIDHLKMIFQRVKGYRRRGVNPCSFFIQGDLPSTLVSEFSFSEDPDRWSKILNIQQEERDGDTFRSALTPTDVRVASGKFQFGKREASELGLAVFAKYAGMDVSSFREAVEEEIYRRLCLEAVCFVGDTDLESLAWTTRQWFRKASSPKPGIDLDLAITLTAPVIGAGAPAAAYLPLAFQKLNTECILPEAYSVACAIGAVVGVVDVHLTGEIRPTASGKYSLHTPQGKEVCDTLPQALDRGRFILEALAGEQMVKNHVADPLTNFSTEERKVKTSSGQEVYLETVLHMEATGRPNVWKQYKKLD